MLVVHDLPQAIDPLREALFGRSEELAVTYIESVDEARRRIDQEKFDGVLLRAGLKRLSLESFRKLAREVPLIVIDDEVPGFTRIEGSSERIVDQVFAVLGIARSVAFDANVLHRIGMVGEIEFERVEWPGLKEPLLRARVSREFVPADRFELAQMAAQVRGAGLAPTVEVFWDDPRPHVLQLGPPGLTAGRLAEVRELVTLEVALSILRVAARGVATLHAAGFSCGELGLHSLWLTERGEGSLVGHGLTLLPSMRGEGEGTPGWLPPEELGDKRAFTLEGDAFRLGLLLLEFVLGVNPLQYTSKFDWTQARWKVRDVPGFEKLGTVGGALAEVLLSAKPPRPTGDALLALIEANTPVDSAAILAPAVSAVMKLPIRKW